MSNRKNRFNGRKFAAEFMGKTCFWWRTLQRIDLKTKNGLITTWVPVECEPRLGWIVGARWLRTGKKENKSNWEYQDSNTFVDTDKRIMAVAVTPWPTQKSIYIPFDSFSTDFPQNFDTIPHAWSKGSRKFIQDWARKAKRDKNGHFLP